MKKGQVDVRVSDDVGDFVCGFIYYESLELLERTSKGAKRDVVFLHVPPLKNKGDIERGVEVVGELVKALAATWLESQDS